jgi:mono/diheme cytochrome c family protein
MPRVIRSRAKLIGLIVASVAAVAVVSGCDATENADLDNGRALFSETCARCHALKEAGSTAVIGPDLDASFAAARDSGMDQDTFEGVVESQIENPRQVGESDPTYMPPNLVEGDDARDVAAYVANVAGVPGIEPPLAAGGEGGQVFANAGCAACHTMAASESTGNVGPDLDDALPGQSAAKIEQSIVDPNAEISQGFAAGIMPEDYGDSITPQDLDLLVEYLTTCSGEVEMASGGGEPTGPDFCFNEEDQP